MMKVNEIYISLQGEGPHAGMRTIFLRLTGCNLRCPYCDTKYAFDEGMEMEIEDLVKKLENEPYITITGGEPLLQNDELCELIKGLRGNKIEIQTNGTLDIFHDFENVIWAMDIKTPSSQGFFCENNIAKLMENDWINFVISDKKDLDFAMDILKRYEFPTKQIYFTPSYNVLPYDELAEWILENDLNVRLGIQLHRLIWGEERKR
ncbi:4Fe-4S cluster-binding domain-containing protein [bacterium]|nr:4Fe-4S cluster-binding domain-containing protein [bacterium]